MDAAPQKGMHVHRAQNIGIKAEGLPASLLLLLHVQEIENVLA